MKRVVKLLIIPFAVFMAVVLSLALFKLLGGVSSLFDQALVSLTDYFIHDFWKDLLNLISSPFRIVAVMISVGLMAFILDIIANQPKQVPQQYDPVIRGRRLGRRPRPIIEAVAEPSDDVPPTQSTPRHRLTRRNRI